MAQDLGQQAINVVFGVLSALIVALLFALLKIYRLHDRLNGTPERQLIMLEAQARMADIMALEPPSSPHVADARNRELKAIAHDLRQLFPAHRRG